MPLELEPAKANCSGAAVRFGAWTGDRPLATFGTNRGSSSIPFQGWRSFKEAFAPELIRRAFEESGRIDSVIDPFGGSGTTALAAQFLGAMPTTIEVNPFLADLIEAKLCRYDFDALVKAYSLVCKGARGKSASLSDYAAHVPVTFLEPGFDDRYLFSSAVASRFFAYRAAIESLADEPARRLFRVLLAGLAVSASNAKISGKGRRYRARWRDRPVHPEFVDEKFTTAALEAIGDIRRFNSRRCRDYKLFRGDARTLIRDVGSHDLSVFSPPYPNSFDYTDVYNIELWMGGYLRTFDDNRELRKSTLRSHVQIHRDMTSNGHRSVLLEKTLEKFSHVKHQLWNKHIPAMIGAYFGDMALVLEGLFQCLRKGGKVYIVVGDSKYAGIDVPVAKILCEQMPFIGFSVLSCEPFRSMQASPQQGGQPELFETLLILKS